GAEPGGQCVRKPMVGAVSYPGDVAVWADQHGGGGADRAEYGELPLPVVARVDQLDPAGPWGDVKVAGLTEVEQQWPCVVQQLEDPPFAVGGGQVEIGHAASEERMSLAELVVNVQPGDDSGEPLARLVHARQLRHDIDQGLHALVPALERALRHRVLERAGSDRVTLGVVGVKEALGGGPADHLSQLPSQVHRILHTEAEALSTCRVM